MNQLPGVWICLDSHTIARRDIRIAFIELTKYCVTRASIDGSPTASAIPEKATAMSITGILPQRLKSGRNPAPSLSSRTIRGDRPVAQKLSETYDVQQEKMIEVTTKMLNRACLADDDAWIAVQRCPQPLCTRIAVLDTGFVNTLMSLVSHAQMPMAPATSAMPDRATEMGNAGILPQRLESGRNPAPSLSRELSVDPGGSWRWQSRRIGTATLWNQLVKHEENLTTRGHHADRRRRRLLPCCCQGRVRSASPMFAGQMQALPLALCRWSSALGLCALVAVKCGRLKVLLSWLLVVTFLSTCRATCRCSA